MSVCLCVHAYVRACVCISGHVCVCVCSCESNISSGVHVNAQFFSIFIEYVRVCLVSVTLPVTNSGQGADTQYNLHRHAVMGKLTMCELNLLLWCVHCTSSLICSSGIKRI